MIKCKNSKFAPAILILIIILVWAILSECRIIPKFMLPSPIEVFSALIVNLPTLMKHSLVTLFETIVGLFFSIVLAFLVSILMDRFDFLRRAIYPILIASQTIPTITIAPILVLFFGYGLVPKILLVVICCFFPITVSLYDGLSGVAPEYMNLLKSMNASYLQTLIHLKFPFSVPYFFSGLTISVTYAFVGAVVSEWLGGTAGLGVYMTRVKSAYSFDKLFAAIIFISLVSLLFIKLINLLKNVVLTRMHMDKRG